MMPNSEIVETDRGEIKVTYRNQTVFCRLCKADHVGRCPIREKEEVERNEDHLRQPLSNRGPFYGPPDNTGYVIRQI